MKRIRTALSIFVLLGTMAVVGVSNSQAKFLEAGPSDTKTFAPECDCELENPHAWGVYDSARQCQTIRCQHDATIDG